MPSGRRGTSKAIRRFNIWFGGIFLGVGVLLLVVGAVIFVALRVLTDVDEMILAVMAGPLGVGLVFSVLGGSFLTAGLRQARREERLSQFGTTVEATVTSVEQTRTRINRRYLWRVRYVYADHTGTTHEGDSGYLSADDAQQYRLGDRAYVRYDPARPSESSWLGREELPKSS